MPTLTVYFDGLCQLCSREIAHYQRSVGSKQIRFVDITSPAFDALYEGVDPYAVHKVMHVKRADGRIATRIDAFVEIWRTLPKYRWLARTAEHRWVNAALRVAYDCFAVVRPYLPRRKRACADSPFCSSGL